MHGPYNVKNGEADSRFSKFWESAKKKHKSNMFQHCSPRVAILLQHLRRTVLPLCRFSIPILMSLTLKSIFMSSTCKNVRPLTRCAVALKYTLAFTPSVTNSSTSDAHRRGFCRKCSTASNRVIFLSGNCRLSGASRWYCAVGCVDTINVLMGSDNR